VPLAGSSMSAFSCQQRFEISSGNLVQTVHIEAYGL